MIFEFICKSNKPRHIKSDKKFEQRNNALYRRQTYVCIDQLTRVQAHKIIACIIGFFLLFVVRVYFFYPYQNCDSKITKTQLRYLFEKLR